MVEINVLLYSSQVVEDGYEFFARRQLVTLFSAPNYCGDYDNAGGMMTINEELMCSFQVRERELRSFQERERAWSFQVRERELGSFQVRELGYFR